jgi:predicted lysophospholipase L1 biosynthesis ABC-type transport system permease subunit
MSYINGPEEEHFPEKWNLVLRDLERNKNSVYTSIIVISLTRMLIISLLGLILIRSNLFDAYVRDLMTLGLIYFFIEITLATFQFTRFRVNIKKLRRGERIF